MHSCLDSLGVVVVKDAPRLLALHTGIEEVLCRVVVVPCGGLELSLGLLEVVGDFALRVRQGISGLPERGKSCVDSTYLIGIIFYRVVNQRAERNASVCDGHGEDEALI